MRKFLQIPTYFFQIIYLIVSLTAVSVIVIYFGLPILGPGLPGSDNGNFITLASWLYKWFPNIPFWYPQQGAGVSFTTFYPILNHLIVVIIAKIFALPIAVAFRYYALISVILTSLGIYILAVRFTRNQTVAALASIFYPLSSIAWIFLLGWGFFAEQASYVFVAPAIVFFELYLSGIYENKSTFTNRLFFLLFLLFSVLSLLGHPLAFIGLIALLVPFFIIYPLFFKKRPREILKKSILIGSFSIGLVIILSLFVLVPFFRYQNIVNQGAARGDAVYSRGLMLQNSIYFKTFFNISPEPVIYQTLDDKIQDRSGDGWRNVAFPIAVSMFALIGFFGSFFLNHRLFALALANLFPLALALSPEILFFLFKTPVLNYFANWRALIIPSRFVIPVLAGFGCYTIAYCAASPIKFLFLKSKGRVFKIFTWSLFVLAYTILTIVIAVFGIYHFKNWPKNPHYLISYGPETHYPVFKPDLRNIWREEIDFCNDYNGAPADKTPPFCLNQNIKGSFWYKKLDKACAQIKEEKLAASDDIEKLCRGDAGAEEINRILAECQKSKSDLTISYICSSRVKTLKEQISLEVLLSKLKIEKAGEEVMFGDEKKLVRELPDNINTRTDTSPGLGSILMTEPFYSNVPELGVYYNQSSLIPLLWNYQITAFYSQSNVWSNPGIVDELAKYFGIEYSFISETNVPMKKFSQKTWKRLDKNPNIFGVLGLWRFKEPTGLLTATTRPLVLVIGQSNLQVFFRYFNLGNIGGLPYDEALLVDGGQNVEDYSVDELKNFDAIIMDGYQYKNRGDAWNKLEKYVKEGGSLYINTGWQYSSADWNLEKTPDFFPLKKLTWTNTGKSKDFRLEDNTIGKDINIKQFAPLVSGKDAWGISSSDRIELKDQAKVILSESGKPLIAGGNFGQGKTIWTGLDLAGHIGVYKGNPEEIKLFHNLMSYLLNGKTGRDIKAVFTRNYPDKVEFTFQEPSDTKTALYWREAYYPDFKAKLVEGNKSENIKVYKAGSGMTLLILPSVKQESKIVYEYKTPFIITMSQIIFLLTLLTVAATVVRPRLFNRTVRIFIDKIGKVQFKKRISRSYDDEDINY